MKHFLSASLRNSYLLRLVICALVTLVVAACDDMGRNTRISSLEEKGECEEMLAAISAQSADCNMVVQHGVLGQRDLDMRPYYWVLKSERMIGFPDFSEDSSDGQSGLRLGEVELHIIEKSGVGNAAELVVIYDRYVKVDLTGYNVVQARSGEGLYFLIVRRLVTL